MSASEPGPDRPSTEREDAPKAHCCARAGRFSLSLSPGPLRTSDPPHSPSKPHTTRAPLGVRQRVPSTLRREAISCSFRRFLCRIFGIRMVLRSVPSCRDFWEKSYGSDVDGRRAFLGVRAVATAMSGRVRFRSGDSLLVVRLVSVDI